MGSVFYEISVGQTDKLLPHYTRWIFAHYLKWDYIFNFGKPLLLRGFGRRNAFKMTLLPQILYLMQAIPNILPQAFFLTSRTMLIKFIWSNKVARLRHTMLVLPKSLRGILFYLTRFHITELYTCPEWHHGVFPRRPNVGYKLNNKLHRSPCPLFLGSPINTIVDWRRILQLGLQLQSLSIYSQ